MNRTHLAWLAALAMATAGCGGGQASDEGRITIVATTPILGDVVGNLVGDGANVEVLMGRGTDPHDFALSARQVETVNEADLVVAIGLGLEESLVDPLQAAADAGVEVLEVAELIDPLPFAGHGEEEEEEEEEEHGSLDPHFWHDPLRMAEAVGIIAEHLMTIEPGFDWQSNADGYIAELKAADADVTDILSVVANRKLVTNHDAFGYLAARYGFEVVGTVIPGGSTLAEPSAADLADLVSVIEREGVRAVFAETANPAALAEAVAAEVGEDVGVYTLTADTLGDDGSPTGTYIGILRTNAEVIAEALS
jgi:zinc/manganese transport system substrate-binding protein